MEKNMTSFSSAAELLNIKQTAQAHERTHKKPGF